MINSSLKRAVVVAMLSGASFGANATTTHLGNVALNVPTSFSASVLAPDNTFNDIFTFSLDSLNLSSGYNVINFPVNIPEGGFNSVLATLTLVSNMNGIVGDSDDVVLKSTVLPSAGNTSENLSLAWDTPIDGPAYLNVTGITNGSLGGLYNGSIAITSAVPEPESFAMLLAGLGLMGAVVRRRSMNKT